MSDAASEVEPATVSRDGGDAAVAETFGMHVRESPPLSWLAAMAALSAMALNQLLLPALNAPGNRMLLRWLDRWGAFASNLAAISGLIALCFGLLAFVRFSTAVSLRKRLLLGGFAGVFLPAIAIALLFERQRTTTQIVLFAIGAAHVLSAIVCTAAASSSPRRFDRLLAVLGAGLAIFSLLAQVLQLVSQLDLKLWQVQAQHAVQMLGEACYLALLIGMSRLVLPARSDLRSRLLRLLALFLLPAALGSMYIAERMLDADYALLLYHAQRVTLFIDSWPRLYAIPIALAATSSIAAAFASDPIRKQGAAGLLLLLGSGYAPHSPGRLLTAVLGMVLIARALIAPARER